MVARGGSRSLSSPTWRPRRRQRLRWWRGCHCGLGRRRLRRTHADRLALALDLLRDPAYDVLLTGSSAFADLPRVMSDLAAGELPALCHTISYPESE